MVCDVTQIMAVRVGSPSGIFLLTISVAASAACDAGPSGTRSDPLPAVMFWVC